MAHAFTKIAFTPKVQAAQERMGSRDVYRETELGIVEECELGAYEIEFIGARDSFYLATVGENGWPYVQHRGGPVGLLKVLDPQTIGYVDFSGNRQYISVGNLDGDGRVCLILMDYPGQRRLKIWGRARLIDEDAEPDLVVKLESPDYRARVEHGVVITVEAFDWNCPKYITPRFTADEFRDVVVGEQQRIPENEITPSDTDEIGSGVLKLVVTGIQQLTPRVRAYELQAPNRGDLPPVKAGAHLSVPVRLPEGNVVIRQYSLVTRPRRHDAYEIAVLREDAGRGSTAIHTNWQLGTRLSLDPPANQFPIHDDDRPSVLMAGGIGITPIMAMAQTLKARGNSFELHYSGRTPEEMAYRDHLTVEFSDQLHLYLTRSEDGTRLDARSILRSAPAEAMFYVCGPARLLEAVSMAARELGVSDARLHYESFE